MVKIIVLGVLSLFLIGCGDVPAPSKTENNVTKVVKKVVDPCEIDYKKCNLECKVSTLNQAKWKKVGCKVKCQTLYSGCETKRKTIQGYKYIKGAIVNKINQMKN